jgi:type IV secretion system protein TrbL
MKYEALQSLLAAHITGLFAGTRHADHSARREGWRGRCPRSLHRRNPAMDANEGRPIRTRDLDDVRADTENRRRHMGRFHGGTDLQSRKCRSVLGSRECGDRSPALLRGFWFRRIALWFGLAAACLALSAVIASAQQYGQAPGNLLDQYRALRPAWFAAVATAANRLFGLLALIEFAWTAAVLVMERTDLQGWTAGLIKRMMFVGAFYALLVNGPTWIPAIIDSFQIIGRNAAGLSAGLSPGEVFLRGLDITNSLCSTASLSGFFSNPAGAFALVLAGLINFLAFVVVSVHFMMAMVESYVVVGAGFLFLGFGGSRWTAPYVERYIALAVAVGVKIMVLYLLVGGGMSLSSGWAGRAGSISSSSNPLLEALDIVGGAIVFMALCWQAPKFTASLLGGSPAFSGGDVAAVGFAGVQTAFIVGSLGAGAAKILAARGAAAGAMNVSQAASMGAGGSSAAGGGSAGGPFGSPGGPSTGGGPTGGGSGPSGSTSRSGGSGGSEVGNSGSGQPAPPGPGSNGAFNQSSSDSSQTKRIGSGSSGLQSTGPRTSSAPVEASTAEGTSAPQSQTSASMPSRAKSGGGTNSSPMTDLTTNSPPSQLPPPSSRTAEFAERLKRQFDRASRHAGTLRQALPPDGHSGAPASLSLNSGDE